MSERGNDGVPSEDEFGEEDTQPISLLGRPRVDRDPDDAEAIDPESGEDVGSQTETWSRGPAPVLIEEVDPEPPASDRLPPEEASASPVGIQSEPPAVRAAPPAPPPAASPAPPLAAPSTPPPAAMSPSASDVSSTTPVLPEVDSLSEAATVVGAAAADGPSRGAIAPSSSLHPMLLERVEPSLGRGERIRLDASHWRIRLGRADNNDVRLYTASASREHAVIAGNEAGEWVVTPAPGKSVKIDGELCAYPVVLEVGMNLVMGTDHLRCVTEGLDGPEMTAQTAAEGLLEESGAGGFGLAGIGQRGWLIAMAAAIGLGTIIFAWFRA